MANTANYGWVKPTVGGSTGAWGTELNTLIDRVDADLRAASNVANAALPKAGGTLSGRVNLTTASAARNAAGNVTGAVAIDMATAQVVSLTLTGAITLTLSNVVAGAASALLLRITNGGNHGVTWPTGTRWPAGALPALTSNGTDLVALITADGGTTWDAFVVSKDSR